MRQASFTSRFFAYLIDQFILQMVAWVAMTPLFLLSGLASSLGGGLFDRLGSLGSALALTTAVLQFVYFGFFWSKNGQSPGKHLVGIRVVGRSSERLSFMQAGLRGSFGYWLSGLVFSLGYIWAAFDADGEAWHDKLYQTRVVIE